MPEIFTAPKTKTNSDSSLFNGLFANYIEKPQDIRFKGQHKEETLILLLRRHWITNLGWITASIILLLIPFFGIPFVDLADLLPFEISFLYVLVGFVFWYLGTLGYILLNFLFWFYNVNIITTQRIVDVDFIYLLYNEISSTVIANIEDVTYKRAGLIGSLFDYGHVFVQTAGTHPNIEFLSVPHPSRIANMITGLIQRRR